MTHSGHLRLSLGCDMARHGRLQNQIERAGAPCEDARPVTGGMNEMRMIVATLSSDFWRLRPSLGYAPTRKSFETTASRQLSRPQLSRPQKQRKNPSQTCLV